VADQLVLRKNLYVGYRLGDGIENHEGIETERRLFLNGQHSPARVIFFARHSPAGLRKERGTLLPIGTERRVGFGLFPKNQGNNNLFNLRSR
jgi:hypothetical protein